MALIEQLAAGAGIARRTFTERGDHRAHDLRAHQRRARACSTKGVALRAADIDVIYVNGYGFPAYRGGPMFYADRVGLRAIHERVSAFHRELGAALGAGAAAGAAGARRLRRSASWTPHDAADGRVRVRA